MAEYLNSNLDLNSPELVEVFDELPFWSAPFGLRLLNKIVYKKNISILDIGSGSGFPLIEIAMRSGNTCSLYGIDPWKSGIKRILKKIKIYGIKNVNIIEAYAEQIPLNDDSVNLVVSNNGLNNVSNLEKALRECARVIRKGGQFVQTVNRDTTMIEFYEIMEELFKELKMKDELKKMKEHIYKKRKPLDEYLSKIRHNGFSVKEVEHNKFEYKFVDGTAMLNYYFIRFAFLSSWKNLVMEEKRSKIFKELELRMNKKADDQGFFKLTVPFVVIDAEKE